MDLPFGENEVTLLLLKVRIFNKAIGKYKSHYFTNYPTCIVKVSNGEIEFFTEDLEQDACDELTPLQFEEIAMRFVFIPEDEISASDTTQTIPKKNHVSGNTRTQEPQFIDNNTYLLTRQSSDKTYGYDSSNPVKVGGMDKNSGPRNQQHYLNALLDPNGGPVAYKRLGNCCPFETPNGAIGNTGVLDKYILTWRGNGQGIILYLNMYDYGDLEIPDGFTAKKKIFLKTENA